jgi:hypothetical protein
MPRIAVIFVVLLAWHDAGAALDAQSAEKAAAVSTAAGKPGAKSLTAKQQAWLARAHRHDRHGWVYVHIEGKARALGFQHGYLLANEIADSLHDTRRIWEYESGMDWLWLVEQAKKMFVPKIDKETLAELDGLAEGLCAAGVPTSREEMVAYNGIIELSSYWWPGKKKDVGDKTPPSRQSCSAVIATGSMTADGGIVMGHNTMSGYADALWNVILDIQPAKGHRILMQAGPGWIHSGTDFFITDAGLVGTETTIGGFKGFDEKGIPEFVRMRRATQDASTIDEWCAIMKKGNNGGYANAWLLGDVNTGEIARLELGLKHVGFEKKKDGYFVGSNVAEDLKLLRFETSVHETDIRLSSVARRVRWKQLMAEHAGKIDLELAKAFEADHYDAYLQKDNPSNRSLCSHEDLDPQPSGSREPFRPGGTVDAKVVDSRLAKQMSFAARWGAACGRAFDAEEFLQSHAQFDWMRGLLKSRPSQPWAVFHAGEER